MATAPASISVLRRDRDSSAICRASTRSSLSPASGAATRTAVGVVVASVMGNSVMNNLNPRGNLPGANLSGATEPAESETARLVARARVMMIISALTTLLASAAVVTVIGYRVYGGGASGPATEDIVTLPK